MEHHPKTRNFLAACLLVAVGVWGAVHEMQNVVILVTLIALMILFKRTTISFIQAAQRFARRLDSAKFKELELKATSRGLEAITSAETQRLQALLLADAEPDVLGLMLLLHQEGAQPVNDVNRRPATWLRDRSLLKHDAQTLHTSTSMKLTELGERLAARVMSPDGPQQAS